MAYKGFDLTGKVALVTGGNGGIGFGMADAMAEAGADVCIWGTNARRRPTRPARSSSATAARSTPRSSMSATRSRSTTPSPRPSRSWAMSTTASPMPASRAAARARSSRWTTRSGAASLRVNLDGVFFTFRAAAKHMVERGKGGSLVAMASTAAIEGAARSSHYGASKGGVCAMVRALAVELARYKIARQFDPAGLDRDRDDGQCLRQREVRRQRDAAHSRAPLGRRRRFRPARGLPRQRRDAATPRGATSSSMAAIRCSSSQKRPECRK